MTVWPGTEETVRIVITDNGMGIPKQEIPKLFKEFYRASNVQDRVGTGLGLAIVKEIVDKHEGKIEVESEVGLGTTSTVHLPLVRREEIQERVAAIGKESPLFINEKEIEDHLRVATRAGAHRAREVIAKAKELKGLDSKDVAALLQCQDPEVMEELFHAAREVKEAIKSGISFM